MSKTGRRIKELWSHGLTNMYKRDPSVGTIVHP